MAKCNVPPEEWAELVKRPIFSFRTADELQAVRMIFSQYCFVNTWGERDFRDCRCSACEARWQRTRKEDKDFFRLHHGDGTVCPYCGEKLKIQMVGKMGKGYSLHQTEAVSFVNVDEDGAAYIDSGIVFWDYYDDGYGSGNMDGSFVSKRRYYIAPGKAMCFKRSIYNSWRAAFEGCRVTGWEPMKNITEPFQKNWLYGFDGTGRFIGLEKLEKSALKYCEIRRFYEDEFNFEIEYDDSLYSPMTPLLYVPQYLAEYAMRPQIEMAVKLGMSEAVMQLLNGNANARHLNWKAKTPPEFLKLTKQEAKDFLWEPSMALLRWYHDVKPDGAVKSVEEARRIRRVFSETYTENVMGIAGKYGIRLKRAENYLKNPKRTAMWVDYVDMAEKLQLDLSREDVLLPKNLEERHDQAAASLKVIGDEIVTKAYEKRREKLERDYGFSLDGLCIVVPRNAAEIVREGKTLHHCVGGYADRHIKGATTILFLRRERKPETPFITIEMTDDGKIRQIHGYKNECYPFSVNPAKKYAEWLEVWQKWYRSGSKKDKAGKPVIKERKTA